MSDNYYQDGDSAMTTATAAETSSETTVFSKRFTRRTWFQQSRPDTASSMTKKTAWFNDERSSVIISREPELAVAAGMSARRRARPPVRRSRAATDLTRGMRKITKRICAGESSKNDVKPDTETGTSGSKRVMRERYGPNERAGTFEMFGSVAGGVCHSNRPETIVSIEFAVWRKAAAHSGHCAAMTAFNTRRSSVNLGRVPWFTTKREMTWTQATAIRVLEVWTNRSGGGHGFPLKIVFLPK